MCIGCRLAQEGQSNGAISSVIPVGSLVKGTVSDVKPYGLVCDLDPDPEVVGFVAVSQQVGMAPSPLPQNSERLDCWTVLD